MKWFQKLVTVIAAVICCEGSALSMNVASIDATKIEIMTENTFRYLIPSNNSYKNEFYLESDLVQPDFMVVGMQYNDNGVFGYWITPVNQRACGLGILYADTVTTMLNKTELKVGDLLSVDGSISAKAITPTNYNFKEAELKYLGYGPDILGETFVKVIRHQLVLIPEYDEIQQNEMQTKHTLYGILLVMGDTDASGEVNVLDCVKLSKYLLGEEKVYDFIHGQSRVCDYSWIVSDINQDGEIDVFDLGLLKAKILNASNKADKFLEE